MGSEMCIRDRCMSIGISDMFNDKFAGIGLEGGALQVFKIIVFGLLTGLFFNAMLRQLPKKYQSRKYLF